MNKTTLFIVCGLLIWLGMGVAHAENTTTSLQTAFSSAQITLADLGVDAPGILPTSPFYFAKEWRRSASIKFARQPMDKLMLELIYLNEKAAEAKKLALVAPKNASNINVALVNYEVSLDDLGGKLSALSGSENKNATNYFLKQLLDVSLRHIGLFDDLKTQFAADKNTASKIENTQNTLARIVLVTAERFDTPANFQNRLDSIRKETGRGTDAIRSLILNIRLRGAIGYLEEPANPDFKNAIESARKSILAEMQDMIASSTDEVRTGLLGTEFFKQFSEATSTLATSTLVTPTSTPEIRVGN